VEPLQGKPSGEGEMETKSKKCRASIPAETCATVMKIHKAAQDQILEAKATTNKEELGKAQHHIIEKPR